MNIKHTISLCLFLVLFTGCVKNNTPSMPIKEKLYPAWFLNPQKDSYQYIFATASGKNKNEAIANALNEAIGKLSITIESSFESNKAMKNGIYKNDIYSVIHTKIAELNINNFEIINFDVFKYNEYLIQIKIDKPKLCDYLKTKFLNEIQNIELSEKKLLEKDSLTKTILYAQLYEKARLNLSMAYVIYTLDSEFDVNKYENFTRNINNNYQTSYNNLSVTILNQSDDKSLITSIESYLVANNFKIGKNNDLILKYSMNSSIANTDYMDIVIFNVTLTLFEKSKIIGQNIFEIKVPKKGDMPRIKENARVRFLEEIQKMPLEKIFNLDVKE